jgi:hypothetical protein
MSLMGTTKEFFGVADRHHFVATDTHHFVARDCASKARWFKVGRIPAGGAARHGLARCPEPIFLEPPVVPGEQLAQVHSETITRLLVQVVGVTHDACDSDVVPP